VELAAAKAAESTGLSVIAKAALSSYYKEKKSSGKDVWEQAVPKAQYSVKPFAQPAVLTGAYPKKPSAKAKEIAAHLGCDIPGDIAHVHCQLVDAGGKVVAKATITELGDAIGLNETNIDMLFSQPYTMECGKGDIANNVSRKWTIS
jgi:hypothetical protein